MEQSLNSILSMSEVNLPKIDVFQSTDDCDTELPDVMDSQIELIELGVVETQQDIEPSNEEDVIENCISQAPSCDETFINQEKIAELHDMLFDGKEYGNVEEEEGERKDTTTESSRPSRRNSLKQQAIGTKGTRSKRKTGKKPTLKSSLDVCSVNVKENNDNELNDEIDSEFIDFNHHSMHLITKHFEFFPCHNCCLLFVSNEKLNEHCISPYHEANLGTVAKSYDSDYTFLDESSTLNVYSCGECSKSFSRVGKLKSHVICHASKFDCPIENCGSQFKHLARLSIHVCKKHINMKHQMCFYCNSTFNSYIDLQLHIKNSCKAKIFECFECGQFI